MTIELDPADPFDKVLISIVETNRRKRQDYASDSDVFSNFRNSARNLALPGFGPTESAYHLLLTKVSRLRSLRINGRMAETANESVLDTILDMAVYSIIVLALAQEQATKNELSSNHVDDILLKQINFHSYREDRIDTINALYDKNVITKTQRDSLLQKEEQ